MEGSYPMSDLSHKINLEKGSFTTVANKLMDLEYIKKTRNEVDKRVYELSLTDSGKRIAVEFATMHNKYINELLNQIDDDKKDEFFKAVKLMKDILMEISKRPADLPIPYHKDL